MLTLKERAVLTYAGLRPEPAGLRSIPPFSLHHDAASTAAFARFLREEFELASSQVAGTPDGVETVVDGLRLRYVPWTADTSDGVQVWEACAECEDYEGWAYEVLHSLSDLGNWLVARYRLQCGEEIGTCDTPCRGHDQTFRR